MTAVLDDRFYPVILFEVAEPFAPGELDAYFQRLRGLADEALRQGRKHVVISMNQKVSMSAAGRSAVAAATKRHLTPAQIDATAATLLVMTSPLERGVVTAFGWLFPETVKSIRPVASRQAALDEALRTLDSLGTPFTGDLEALRDALGLTSAGARSARR
jgi:hypothetical protein